MKCGTRTFLLSSLVIAFLSAVSAAYDSAGKATGSMSVNSQDGTRFTISGQGWSGEGSVSGGSGYYNWRFSDGRTGRTDIRASASDGITQGTVRGSGINWTYTARRTSAPAPQPKTSSGSCVKWKTPTEADADGQWYVPLKNTCTRVVQATVHNGGVRYGVRLAAGETKRQAIGTDGPKPDLTVTEVK
jgi:hypothetical protein